MMMFFPSFKLIGRSVMKGPDFVTITIRCIVTPIQIVLGCVAWHGVSRIGSINAMTISTVMENHLGAGARTGVQYLILLMWCCMKTCLSNIYFMLRIGINSRCDWSNAVFWSVDAPANRMMSSAIAIRKENLSIFATFLLQEFRNLKSGVKK